MPFVPVQSPPYYSPHPTHYPMARKYIRFRSNSNVCHRSSDAKRRATSDRLHCLSVPTFHGADSVRSKALLIGLVHWTDIVLFLSFSNLHANIFSYAPNNLIRLFFFFRSLPWLWIDLHCPSIVIWSHRRVERILFKVVNGRLISVNWHRRRCHWTAMKHPWTRRISTRPPFVVSRLRRRRTIIFSNTISDDYVPVSNEKKSRSAGGWRNPN